MSDEYELGREGMNLRARKLENAAEGYNYALAELLWAQAVRHTYEEHIPLALNEDAVQFQADMDELEYPPEEAKRAAAAALRHVDRDLGGKTMALLRAWERDGIFDPEVDDLDVLWFLTLRSIMHIDDVVLFTFEDAPEAWWADTEGIGPDFDPSYLRNRVVREAELWAEEHDAPLVE